MTPNQQLRFVACILAASAIAPAYGKEMKCLAEPASTAKDVKADVAAKVEGLRRVVDSASFSAQLGIVTSDLYSKYPNANRLVVAQMLLSQVCSALNSLSISDEAKLAKYSETEKLVFQLATMPPAAEGSGAKR